MNDITVENLTAKKLLLKNSLISLFIQAGPALVAFFTIPALINGLGTEKFGILTLIWAIIGASSILDFGLGHALTQFVSKKIGLREFDELQNYIITAVVFIFLLGVVAAVCIYFSADIIVKDLFNTHDSLVEDTVSSFHLLSITIPFLMLNICLVGLLEACQEFKTIGILKLPIIFCNYVAPLFVLLFSKSLTAVVSVLVIGRIISSMAYLWFSLKIIRNFSNKIKVKLSYIKPLLAFGSWMTISNIINTIVVNIDRFIIAGMISTKVVAYYTTPLDALIRLWIIPSAIMSVMFPAFSTEYFTNRERAKKLYFKCLKTVFFIIFPVCVIFFVFAKQSLTLWIGNDFAEQSHLISQILIVGILLQALNIVSYNFVQSTGKSEIQAKIHLIEFPIYLASIWFFIKQFGLKGAAMAWLLRIIIDFSLFKFFSFRLINVPEKNKQLELENVKA